jgi:Na+/H+ antiporter NhaC
MNKKKKSKIGLIIFILIVLLFPVRVFEKADKTVKKYKAVLYSVLFRRKEKSRYYEIEIFPFNHLGK